MRSRLFRYLLLYPLTAVVIGTLAVAAWLSTRGLSSLPPARYGLTAHAAPAAVEHKRRLQHVVLDGGPLGNIGIMVSLPDPLPSEKMPLLVVLGGLGTGENNIRTIEEPGDNVIIGYDWPMPVAFPKGMALLRQTPDLYKRIMTIPGQIASSIAWAAAQPWGDRKRVSVLGYSLGALAAPAAVNMAEHDDYAIGWTILAYGGAPFSSLFIANPRLQPKWLGYVADLLLHPLQPTVNLPDIKSHILVLEGRDDALIPEQARATLRDAVPDPRDVVVFGGDHMGVGPGKQELLARIIRVSREWLIRNGAVNAI